MLDFVVYYMTGWFNRNPQLLKWSTSVERACYVLTITMMSFVFGLDKVLENTLFLGTKLYLSQYALMTLGIMLLIFLPYLYIRKNRYSYISKVKFNDSKITEKTGFILCVVLVFACILFPYIVALLFRKKVI